jgi:hypothetical protein
VVRDTLSTPLPQLQNWQPTPADKELHEEKIKTRQIPPDSVCEIDWPKILKQMWNSVFIHPKFKQLIWWITTSTIHTGNTVNIYRPGRGFCPSCATLASVPHMFSTCPEIQRVWSFIDTIGYAAWDEYEMYHPNDPPHLLREYSPVNLIKLCTLWAIWTTWTTLFFEDDADPLPADAWYPIILNKAKSQFISRLYESAAVMQWIQIAQSRRNNDHAEQPRGCSP